MLKFLMFQGLPNNNIVINVAESRVPRVQLTIAPTCRHKFSKLKLIYKVTLCSKYADFRQIVSVTFLSHAKAAEQQVHILKSPLFMFKYFTW